MRDVESALRRVKNITMKRAFIATVLILANLINVSTQGRDDRLNPDEHEACAGPVYERKEVSRPAKFTLPEVGMTNEARAKGKAVRVGLTAVLCRTGRVTDIRVVKGAPDGMMEKVVEALRRMKFTPAEKDGAEVSQRLRVEFEFLVY